MKSNVNENVNVNEEVENVVEKNVESQEEIQELKIFLEREQYKVDGKPYWNYVVKSMYRERPIKADFVPKDKGGYEFLDLIFSVAEKAELLMVNGKMADSFGNVTRYTSYRARAIDNGINLVVDVKPREKSDTSYLDLIIQLNSISKK